MREISEEEASYQLWAYGTKALFTDNDGRKAYIDVRTLPELHQEPPHAQAPNKAPKRQETA